MSTCSCNQCIDSSNRCEIESGHYLIPKRFTEQPSFLLGLHSTVIHVTVLMVPTAIDVKKKLTIINMIPKRFTKQPPFLRSLHSTAMYVTVLMVPTAIDVKYNLTIFWGGKVT